MTELLSIAAASEANSSFSRTVPGLQIAMDSTSLGALKTCPRYYEYTIIHGFIPRALSVHLTFGLEYHSALELYDRQRAAGVDHDRATLAAVKQALISTWNFELKRPWASDDSTKNRETLIRTIVWYLDQFADDPLETIILHNGKPAVELSFRFELDFGPHGGGDHYMLCGHLDKLAIFQDKPRIVDRKTTKGSIDSSYFAKYSPDNQVSTYILGGQFIYGTTSINDIIIDAAQVGVNFSRFQRGIVSRTQSQLDEWYLDLQYWLSMAEEFANRQYWPLNDKSCHNYGGCPFRCICGVSAEVRPALLQGMFHKRIWDPLVTREI